MFYGDGREKFLKITLRRVRNDPEQIICGHLIILSLIADIVSLKTIITQTEANMDTSN